MNEIKKVMNLCSGCGKCPVIKITKREVRIGEKGNLCVLNKKEWEVFKKKILEGKC